MKAIHTIKAPDAVGPYVQAIQAGDFLIVSGQLPIDPLSGTMPENIKCQTRQSLENIKSIIEAAGGSMNDVVRCGIFVKDMDDFTKINAIYAEYFSVHKPARATVEVARLPKDALVEIEAMVYLKK